MYFPCILYENPFMDVFFSVTSRYSPCKLIFVEYTGENMMFPFIPLRLRFGYCQCISLYGEVFNAYMRIFRSVIGPEFILSNIMQSRTIITLSMIFYGEEKKYRTTNPLNIFGDGLEKDIAQHKSSPRTHKMINVAFLK